MAKNKISVINDNDLFLWIDGVDQEDTYVGSLKDEFEYDIAFLERELRSIHIRQRKNGKYLYKADGSGGHEYLGKHEPGKDAIAELTAQIAGAKKEGKEFNAALDALIVKKINGKHLIIKGALLKRIKDANVLDLIKLIDLDAALMPTTIIPVARGSV